jgi:hypothetical protein
MICYLKHLAVGHLFGAWGKMQRSRKYQRFAMRCLQETYATTDHRLKVLLAEMAHEWQRIAKEAKDAKGQLRFRSPEADPGD